MASIPDSLARLFDPLEALLADPAVERLLLGDGVHVRRAGVWHSEASPFEPGVLAAAIDALVPEAGALELPLDDGAVLLAFKPPIVEQPLLSLRRRAIAAPDEALLAQRTAWDTLEIARARRMNLVVVGTDPRVRRAFMAALLSQTRGAVLVDLPTVHAGDARYVRLRGADAAALLRWAPRLGGQPVFWDAAPRGVDAVIEFLSGREAPAVVGVPGHRSADGLAWLAGHSTQAGAATLLGASVDLVVCVDDPCITAIHAVEASPTGPVLVPLHLALPSGALTDERGHTDWTARWQRVTPPTTAAVSLPPESLTNALRAARAQAQDSALPLTDVPGRSDEAEATVERSVSGDGDPLQALLAQLGEPEEIEEDVDLDLSEDDEHEETMVQVEGVTARGGNRRTFSEILRSLDDAPSRPIHVRRGERITQIRDED